MKKVFQYLIILSLFISCQEDVKFNTPALQGIKDNVFWRAIDSKATISATGALEIVGYTSNEKLTLKTTSTTAQVYFLGTSDSKKVVYELNDSSGIVVFSTGFGLGDGQIVITEYDAVNNTVSGTFKFNAENIFDNPLAGPMLNFQQGVFYKVPVSSQAID
jgi:hypothetical protein